MKWLGNLRNNFLQVSKQTAPSQEGPTLSSVSRTFLRRAPWLPGCPPSEEEDPGIPTSTGAHPYRTAFCRLPSSWNVSCSSSTMSNIWEIVTFFLAQNHWATCADPTASYTNWRWEAWLGPRLGSRTSLQIVPEKVTSSPKSFISPVWEAAWCPVYLPTLETPCRQQSPRTPHLLPCNSSESE